jgi:Holliday junction resolvasome RuvABC ATP-dependent DNA helicase subunit
MSKDDHKIDADDRSVFDVLNGIARAPYKTAVEAALRDGVLTSEKQQQIKILATDLGLSELTAREVLVAEGLPILRGRMNEVAVDSTVSLDEELSVQMLAEALGVSLDHPELADVKSLFDAGRDRWWAEHVPLIPVQQRKQRVPSMLAANLDENEYKAAVRALNDLIGLDQVKREIETLANLVRVQKMRQAYGLAKPPLSLHLVFTGNPGTGKTTVARLIGRIYKSLGVLTSGKVTEVDRGGLVAGYIGQTAIKTTAVIEKTLDGVLFLDEAYALARPDTPNDLGQEAIDTLLKAMEDHRDRLVVIVAGYTNPMKIFIESNPGLKSRFNKYIHFPDYTPEELTRIFEKLANENNYLLNSDAEEQMRRTLQREYTEAGGRSAMQG